MRYITNGSDFPLKKTIFCNFLCFIPSQYTSYMHIIQMDRHVPNYRSLSPGGASTSLALLQSTEYLSQYLTKLMHKICFTVTFISCLYMFRAHVLIIRRSKLHYTVSGIITLEQVSGLKLLRPLTFFSVMIPETV